MRTTLDISLRSRDPPGIPPYDQPPPRYRREPYGPPQPHRMGSVQTRRPTCWDPPRQRTDNCYPPPYRDPDMVPDSYVEPRNSYARYRPWQPLYHPSPATKAEDPINAKLDRLLEAFDKIETWVDATNRRFSKFRSSPQPEPDLDQPNVSAPIRKRAYPPSGNNGVSFGPSRLVPNDSAAPPRHSTKSDQPLARQSSCWEPSLMATPVVDQKPPLQHVLDQKSPRSHRRAAAPPAPAAAPPPLLHVDQQPSPSCCHPTTHLRQAEACLELPTTVQQPLLQLPPSNLHPPSLHSATKLVSCEEQYLGIEGDSKVLNQVDLLLNVKKVVDVEEGAIEVNKIDKDDGLHDPSKIAAFDFDGCLAKMSVNGVNAHTWSLVSPSIPQKLHNPDKDELHDAREDTVNGLKDISIYSRMGVKRIGELDNKPFHDTIMQKFAEDVYIGYAIVGYWRLKQRSCPFDPGGDASPKFLQSTLVVGSWFPP